MRLKGIVHHLDLSRRGIDRAEVLAAMRAGAVRRVGPWFAHVDADRRVLAFLAAGVRPTCLDAAALHGLWTPPSATAHAFKPRTSGVPTHDDGSALCVSPLHARGTGSTPAPLLPVMLHGPVLRTWPDFDPVPDLPLVLSHAGRCLSVRDTAILMESALHGRRIGPRALERVIAGLPRDVRRPLARLKASSESGTETAVRWWLEAHGVEVRSQVVIPEVGRVDLLVGTRWVIECDSVAHHTGRAEYHADRHRDLALAARGYMVTRLTWEQVFLGWDSVEPRLLEVIRRGDHRRPLAA